MMHTAYTGVDSQLNGHMVELESVTVLTLYWSHESILTAEFPPIDKSLCPGA